VRDIEASHASFADIAVALTLASGKLQLDLAQTEIIATRIGLSKMGLALVVEGLQRDAKLVEHAIELFKKMAEVEPQVRAVLARKEKRYWPDFSRAAAV
jgi:hypothetical protein